MKYVIGMFIFLLSFFIFNIGKVNTIDSIVLLYDEKNINEEDTFTISVHNLNVFKLTSIFDNDKVEILNIVVQDNLYNIKDLTPNGSTIEQITYNLIKDYGDIVDTLGYTEESYYFLNKGFNIKSIKIRCEIDELLILEKKLEII